MPRKTALDEKFEPYTEEEWKNPKNEGTYRSVVQLNNLMASDHEAKLAALESEVSILKLILERHEHLKDGKSANPIKFVREKERKE